MTQLLYIALGGAVGAVGRFGVSIAVLRYAGAGFPWGTLAVNIIGSFLAGVFWAILGQTHGPQRMHALFMIGMLGAFTTFSAFSVESLRLYEDGRSLMALVNVLANNLGALAAVVAGVWAGRSLSA